MQPTATVRSEGAVCLISSYRARYGAMKTLLSAHLRLNRPLTVGVDVVGAVRLQDLNGLVPPGLVVHGHVDDAVPLLELVLVVPQLLTFRVDALHCADQPRDPAAIPRYVDALHTRAAAQRFHGAIGHAGFVEVVYRFVGFAS